MKAKIGLYEIEHSEGFNTLDEAVKFVLDIYPELDKETVKKNVKSLVNANKSKNSTTANKESKVGDTEVVDSSVKRK